jgi:carbonic anhydrase
MLGLVKGDAKILRNAGARVTEDVLRTLILAVHLLEVERVMVVGHTGCRMSGIDDKDIHDAIARTAGLDTRSLDFGAVQDQHAVLRHDVQRIRSSPYLPAELAVIGCVYDLKTGLVNVVDQQP